MYHLYNEALIQICKICNLLNKNLFNWQLQSPEEKTDSLITITPSILCHPLSTPVELLVKPFRQRYEQK